MSLLDTANDLQYCQMVFGNSVRTEDDFEDCPDHFDKATLANHSALCNTEIVKVLFTLATHFQRDAVSFWNDFHYEVTPSNYLGLEGLDETSSQECGALALSLLKKFGIIEESDCGAWTLKPGYKERYCYVADDVKTVNNISKVVADLQKGSLSLQETEDEGVIIVEAL